MHVAAHGATHVGHVREHNEDSHYVGKTVFAVCDGLGGHAAGEVASSLAVEPLAQLDGRGLEGRAEAAGALHDAIADANRRVFEDAQANPERSGMGTTLTALVLVEQGLVLGHVGDSRAYRWRGGDLERLSTDHTVITEAVEGGVLEPEEARDHWARHTLTRAVGLDAQVEIDVRDDLDIRPRDRLLLCSDGLTEVVDDEGLGALTGEHGDPEDLCRALVHTVLERGAPDNVTVVAVYAEA